MCEKDGRLESEIKCRGFFLGGLRARSELNVETYQAFVKALEEGDMTKRKLVPQSQILLNPKTGKMYSKFQLKAFTNDIYDKRVIVTKKDHCIMTLPYGYKQELLSQVEKSMKKLKHV